MAEGFDYICEHCKGEFHDVRAEADSRGEYAVLFDTKDEAVRICHNCWVELMAKAQEAGIVDAGWRKYA